MVVLLKVLGHLLFLMSVESLIRVKDMPIPIIVVFVGNKAASKSTLVWGGEGNN